MPISWEQPVYSTNVSAVAYDQEAKEMYVTWLKGKRSVYTGVPEDVAMDCANAPSVGNFLNTEVKGKYGHRYG